MFLPIHLTEESISLIIGALRKLPHEQVHDLVMDIAAQADNQRQAAVQAAAKVADAPKKTRKPRGPNKPRKPRASSGAESPVSEGQPAE